MTDGAALPLALSDLVAQLRARDLLDATITCGHAFGGDYEAVSVYSALAVRTDIAHADAAVVAMGPGVVGTATRLGFSGIEVGPVLDAAAGLRGIPIACLRVSFADRSRIAHRGVSHHSLTALSVATAQLASSSPSPCVGGEDEARCAHGPRGRRAHRPPRRRRASRPSASSTCSRVHGLTSRPWGARRPPIPLLFERPPQPGSSRPSALHAHSMQPCPTRPVASNAS